MWVNVRRRMPQQFESVWVTDRLPENVRENELRIYEMRHAFHDGKHWRDARGSSRGHVLNNTRKIKMWWED